MSIVYRFFLMLGLVVLFNDVIAQCNDWKTIFNYKIVEMGDAAHDRFGNTYVVGSFFEDGFTVGSSSFHLPAGGSGAFIAKIDKNNSVIWAISPTTGYRAYGKQVEIDANDNIIVAGDFETSISFGCLSIPQSGREDLFLAKLSPDGTPLWLTGSSGADDAYVQRISMSPNGNCILAGNFVERSDVTLGLTSPDMNIGGVPVITGAVNQISGGYDSFVASIDGNGKVLWTQGIGGDGDSYDYVSDVTTDSHNNILVTGNFSSPQISFDGYIVHGHQISENYYVAKIDVAGNTQWARETEGNGNMSGSGIATDANDNIFVTGRFYKEAKFGSVTLTTTAAVNDADVFIVKLSPQGTAVSVQRFGNKDFDSGTAVEVNSQGKVLVSAYYYSTHLDVGPFSSDKSYHYAESFVATLSNDLATVECVKFITGEGQPIVLEIEIDPYDNTFAMTDLMPGGGQVVNFDSQTLADPDYWSVIAVLGDNPATNESELQKPFFPLASIGKDTTLCSGQTLTLSVNPFCNASWKWSTGSTNTSIVVEAAGVYWVDYTWNGKTVRDEITVSFYEPIHVNLGEDRMLCPGEVASWTLPVYNDAMYKWSDGGSSNEKSLSAPGVYWVELSNRCETVRSTVTLQRKLPSKVDLGNDVVTCNSSVTLSYTPAAGETIRWPDGSVSSTFLVTTSGAYQLAVNNGCVETTDEILVTFKNVGKELIPNVVTVNGDGKNDHFILPDGDKWQLFVYNRWGTKIFHASDYQNDWPTADLSAGIYFFTLDGECLKSWKGTVQVVR